jgi:predicted phage terminase large subunit-like protein
MTRKEFAEKVKDLIKLITETTSHFPDDSAEKQLERIKRAKTDFVYFAQTYFPHYVEVEFADWHLEELNKIETSLDTDLASIVAEIWARGFGKTTLLSVILPIWAGLTKKSWFSIFVGKDQKLSRERTVVCKLELCFNGRIKTDFPELAMRLDQGEETDYEVNGLRYIALGYKQAMRGRVHGRHRPRLIIIDDLENHTDTNPEIAQEKFRYVLEEAFGAFGNKGGLIIWLGNLTNSGSALAQFVEKVDTEPDNPHISYRIIKAQDDAGRSRWPQAYSEAMLEAKKQVMGKAGYDRHFMMKPGIDGDVFQEGWLKFYNPWTQQSGTPTPPGLGENPLPSREQLLASPVVSYCDPSLGGGESNDYKAILTVAFWGGRYFILDVYMRKASILEMLAYQYELDRRFKTRQFMEKNFWQSIIWQYLPQVAAERGYMLGIQGIENRLKKEERILSLQPLYEWGHIYHCTQGRDWTILKEQLLGFPNAAYDDGPDALAGAIERFREMATANKYQTLERGRESLVKMF